MVLEGYAFENSIQMALHLHLHKIKKSIEFSDAELFIYGNWAAMHSELFIYGNWTAMYLKTAYKWCYTFICTR